VSAWLTRVNRVERGLVIDTPTRSEAADVARVHVQTWQEAYGGLLPPRFFDEAALRRRIDFWDRLLTMAESPYTSAVARDESGIVGVALSGPTSAPQGFVARAPEQLFVLYVLASRHGTGVGQALLDRVVGGRPAELWVSRDNPRARGFYARNGFEPDGDEQVDEDFGGLVDLRMVRSLARELG
jgi:GNAT superfamily N-acetyltransferase